MDKRALRFMIVSAVFVLLFIVMQVIFLPNPARNKNNVAENEAGQNENGGDEEAAGDDGDSDDGDSDDGDSDDGDSDDGDSDDGDSDDRDSDDVGPGSADSDNQDTDTQDDNEQTSNDPSGNDTEDTNAGNQESGDANTDEGGSDETDAGNSDDESSEDKPLEEITIEVSEGYPHKLVTLGSLAKGSPYRMLATFNSVNGTVHRLELSDRLPNGLLRYQETDGSYGYLGNMDLEEYGNEQGAMIQVVGPGTPASMASPSQSAAGVGLKIDDVITQVNETPITNPRDFDLAMEATRPGQEIEIQILRDDQSLTYSAKLSRRPMQVIAPATDVLDPDEEHQESFILRLGVVDERESWRAFNTEIPMSKAEWDTYELTHTIVGETEFYTTSLQQGEPPNGTFRDGLPVEVSEANESAAYVRADDGRAGWVPRDSIRQANEKVVAFAYWLDSEEMASLQRQGPIEVVKRYRLATTPSEEAENRFYPSYHLEFEIELRNFNENEQSIAFQLDGPTGAATEGWWFANKIHGRSTALFYSAGARDVVGGSEFTPFRFYGGPEIFSNEMKKGTKKSYNPLEIFTRNREREYRQVNFLGVDSQYFNVSLLPEQDNEGNPFFCTWAQAISASPVTKEHKKYRKLVEATFRVTSEPIVLAPYDYATPDSAYRLNSKIFAGPKEPRLLTQYELDDTVSYGWFALFSRPLVGLLHLFYSVIGNYGLAIIMLTILVRSCMIPISRKAVRNAQMMQYLQPEMKKIAEKYKNDFEKRGQAQRELFRRYKYNPMGGCLLVFLQLPIFIGLYRGLSVDIALRDQSLIPGIQWCANLAAPDKLIRWDSIPIPFLFSEVGWLGPYFNILPIITIILFLIQQKLFTPPATDEQMRMTQKMMTYMMIFIGVMFFKVPSGLCIYFITSSLWGIAERKLIPKPKLPENLPPLPSDKDGGNASGSAQSQPQQIELSKAAEERREQQKIRRKKLKGR